MRQVGLDPDDSVDLDEIDPIAAALDMITTGWGAYVSEEMISGPLCTARIHPRPADPIPQAQPPEDYAALLESGEIEPLVMPPEWPS